MATPADLAGIANAPQTFSASVDSFTNQNMSPSDVANMSSAIPQTLGGISILGSRIPSLAKINIPGTQQLNSLLAPISSARFGVAGSMESVHYADDLVNHHPKFKFLFKVGFYGFPGGKDYYYYVHRCDKPKVKFNHQDVNYYNFRTRVLTSVSYEPLQISFLDEVGDSVFTFFKAYIEASSGTGQGNYGIDKGWGTASSSIPYKNAYSMNMGQKIIMEQVFIDPAHGQGAKSNRFVFINPRIESFDLDDLSHEDSSTGSMANITFSYDAIEMHTQHDTTIYSWGVTDLFKAGGTSAPESNASNVNGNSMSSGTASSASIKQPATSIYDMLQKGSTILNNIPNTLGGAIANAFRPVPSSYADTNNLNISKTLASAPIMAGTPNPGNGPNTA